MSRSTRPVRPPRAAGTSRDRRVTTVAVGLTVVAAVLLSPIASDATSRGRNAAGSGATPAPTGGGPSTSAGPTGESSSQPTGESSAGSTPSPAPSGEPLPGEGTDPTGSGTPGTSNPANPTSSVSPTGQQPSDGSTPPAQSEILGNTCEGSELTPHDGFQNGNRCVSTQFGEVGNAETNPTLLISSAPRVVRANQPFDLRVSTRNLVRDRFLAAARGGYYKESSFLNADGLVRGHFHTACRTLSNRRTAPDAAPVPAFFAATEDGGGGSTPDTVTVRVPGLPRGLAQCAVWAGDGSHRLPMMQRANQIPAFDVVRIFVS